MSLYQKYNVVFLWSASDYGCLRIADVHNFMNTRVLSLQLHKKSDGNFSVKVAPLCSMANPYAFQKKINSLDFKNYFDEEFPAGYPIIWIILGDHYSWMKSIDYFNYLRRYYPDSKLVLNLTNPVHYYQSAYKMFLDDSLQKEFDAILTYQKADAVNFGLTHYIGFYSVLPIERQEETSDIFFVGLAKDRLDKIHKFYKYFKSIDLKCDFHIVGVPPELQEFPQEISYNKMLSYVEVLDHVMQSRGILEIAQGGNYGLTMRFFEALAYDKNFITDNGFLNQEKFLCSPKLFYIPKYKKFHLDREKYLAAAKLSNNYKNEYSPVHYLEFLEALFNSEN